MLNQLTGTPSKTSVYGNIAQIIGGQGRYADAEITHREELVLFEKAVGKEHPLTLTTMINLTRILGSQGKYPDADITH